MKNSNNNTKITINKDLKYSKNYKIEIPYDIK